MGCCSSSSLKYEQAGKHATLRSTSSSSLLLSSPEWTYLSKDEMAQLLNKINLVPFPEKRMKVLLSVKSRLLTYDDFCSILALIPTDEEKFVVLQMLFETYLQMIKKYPMLLTTFSHQPSNKKSLNYFKSSWSELNINQDQSICCLHFDATFCGLNLHLNVCYFINPQYQILIFLNKQKKVLCGIFNNNKIRGENVLKLCCFWKRSECLADHQPISINNDRFLSIFELKAVKFATKRERIFG